MPAKRLCMSLAPGRCWDLASPEPKNMQNNILYSFYVSTFPIASIQIRIILWYVHICISYIYTSIYIYICVCVRHITSIHPQEISPSQAPDVFSAGSPRHPARARPPWSPTSWETRGRCPSLTRRLRRLCYGGKISPHWTNGYLWGVKGG
jgi:hypothetical protein